MLPELDVASIRLVQKSFAGEFTFDLAERVWEEADFVEYNPPRRYEKVFSKMTFKEGQTEVYQTEGASQGTLILFRDSNGTALLPYLVPHFSRSIVVASARVFHEAVRSEPCALVITQMAERYLGCVDAAGKLETFPDDFDARGFVEATGASIPLPSRQKALLDIDLRAGGNAERFLGDGWSNAEPTHRWAIGPQCLIKIPATALAGPTAIEFSVLPFVDQRSHPRQRAVVFLNDVKMFERAISATETISVAVPVDLQGKSVTLKIVTPDAVAPKDLGLNDETRVVSFLFDHVFVRRLRGV
jgi:hypothetical protein